MGCAASRIDKEERVQICKERKRVVKQLLGFRKEFASAILAYLKALKDTGITLRQFTELESLELEGVLPSSLPLPLPPSPPLPPPVDSPDSRKLESDQNGKEVAEEIIEIGEESICTPPPPNSSLDLWDLLGSSSAQHKLESLSVQDIDEETWAETRSQFEEEDQEHVTFDKAYDAVRKKSLNANDDSSMVTGHTKHMVHRPMVAWKRTGRRKSLSDIVKELDDYFLKASAGGKEIAVLVDMGTWNNSQHHDLKEGKGKGNNSARLSSLSWSWSSRSLQVTRDAFEVDTPIEPCKPGAHCITLWKIFAEEQTLYTAIRGEEIAKLEHEQKSSSLQKQEDENSDLKKIEKTRCAVEKLQSDIVRLQELVTKTSASILTAIEQELHPQLIVLLSGLHHMWRTMYECHEVQSHISQQVHHLTSHNTEPSTDQNHHDAAMQLESGINFWYNSFCRLTKSQRDYVQAICTWIRLLDCPIDNENQNRCPSMVRALCEKWLLALDRLPEKVVSEAINSFLSVIRSIISQQEKECGLKKKIDRLERRWQKELKSQIEMEKKLEVSNSLGDMESGLSPKHPLSVKRAKTDALKKVHEDEKAKYLSYIQVSRTTTLSDLQNTLPRLFEALMGFASACTQAFETALNQAQQVCDAEQSQAEC